MKIEPEIIFFIILPIILTSSTLCNGIETIYGRRAPCTNEGEDIHIDSIDMKCFKCICQNGFVECDTESCPSVDGCYMLVKKQPGGCCDRCKECVYKGQHYPSGSEWSDPDDPCASFKCVAGVITESNIQCYTPCSDPLSPRPGQCCPTCIGCYFNGQDVLNGREVTLSEDPCLKCQCSNKRLTCIKKACPVLHCPISKQIKAPGECCPRCSEKREVMTVPGKCILGKGFHVHREHFKPDHCSKCVCLNGTSVCQRNTCPVLECAPEFQKQNPSDCCPTCPEIAEFRSTCHHDGKQYQHNDTWNLNPCRSCKCHSGEIRCAETKCVIPKCRPNETLVTPAGQCCSKCVETEGICTVFGDPHYKTFDGKFYSFQGTCKYQLTSDCVNNTFSIRVTNDGRDTKYAAWTKTVTIKIGSVKVNLGQKTRIKVNGKRVTLPFKHGKKLSIKRHTDGLILLDSEIGVQLLWDGSNYLQVQAPVKYKNKLCGLCGNYNNVWRDDLISRQGINMSDEDVWKFANSWRVGGVKSCGRKQENLSKNHRICRNKKNIALCRPLKETDVFDECSSRLNPQNYYHSCKKDMCECPTGRCYCESFAAYARECQRLGVPLSNWRKETNCLLRYLSHSNNNNNYNSNNINYNSNTGIIVNSNNLTKLNNHKNRHRNRTRKLNSNHNNNNNNNNNKSNSNHKFSHNIPNTFLYQNNNNKLGFRTPPPLKL